MPLTDFYGLGGGGATNYTDLTDVIALSPANNKIAYFTNVSSIGITDFTPYARTLLDDNDAATARTTLGLAIGTNVQAYDAELAAIAGLTSAADRLPYFTGSGTAALATFTTAGRNLVDDADAAAQRTTLGLGTAAIVNTGTSGATIPLLNGANTWSGLQTFNANIAGTGTASGDTLALVTGSARFRIASTGRVAINSTSAPSAVLVVDNSGNNRAGFSSTAISAEGGSDTSSNYATYYRNQSAAIIMATRCDRRVGITINDPDANLHVVATATGTTPCIVQGLASQTAALLQLNGVSSTAARRQQLEVVTSAVDNTDASRKYAAAFNIFDTAARECIKLEASGTAAKIGVFGATPVIRQTVSAAATDAATTQTLVNDLRTALIALGWVA